MTAHGGEHRTVEWDFDTLALLGCVAPAEGQGDRDDPEHRRVGTGDGQRCKPRRVPIGCRRPTTGARMRRIQAGAGTNDGFPSRRLPQGMTGSKPWQGTVNHPGVLRRQRLVANAETLGHTWAEIFNDHICRAHQRLRLALSLGRVQIDHDRLLAAIPDGKRRMDPCWIPLRPFYLDHLGTLIGQQHAC